MLFYSHVWDFALKLLWMAVLVALVIALHIEDRLHGIGITGGYAVFVTIAVVTVVWIVVYRQWLSTLAAWLYATVNLGARVSLGDARQLAHLVQLDVTLKWLPLKEVKGLPRANRRDALLAALGSAGPTRKAMLF
jgi:hypothetical protein